MMRNILAGMLLLLVSACGNSRPEGILSEKQMVHAMSELYLAEERASRLSVSYDSLKKVFPRFSEKAFERAGVTDSVFSKSMDYYMTNPEQFEKIYATVIDSLNLRAQRVDAQKHKTATKKDSVDVKKDSVTVKKDSVTALKD